MLRSLLFALLSFAILSCGNLNSSEGKHIVTDTIHFIDTVHVLDTKVDPRYESFMAKFDTLKFPCKTDSPDTLSKKKKDFDSTETYLVNETANNRATTDIGNSPIGRFIIKDANYDLYLISQWYFPAHHYNTLLVTYTKYGRRIGKLIVSGTDNVTYKVKSKIINENQIKLTTYYKLYVNAEAPFHTDNYGRAQKVEEVYFINEAGEFILKSRTESKEYTIRTGNLEHEVPDPPKKYRNY